MWERTKGERVVKSSVDGQLCLERLWHSTHVQKSSPEVYIIFIKREGV